MAQYDIQTEKIGRIFNILGQLSPHSQITIKDLAVEYETDERNIKRDIEVLKMAGLGVFEYQQKIRISRIGYKKIKSWMIG